MYEIARQQLSFHTIECPEVIQARLERDLHAVLFPLPEQTLTTFETHHTWAGLRFQLRLSFEAAFEKENAFTFAALTAASKLPQDLPALQRNAASWFSFWTRDWRAHPPIDGPSPELYLARSIQWLADHNRLLDASDLQALILEAMRGGATFSTAHKEGGTNIYYRENMWVRSDYGDSDDYEIFHRPEDFLAALRRFYDHFVSRNTPPPHAPVQLAPESTAWRLIYRHLRAAKPQ